MDRYSRIFRGSSWTRASSSSTSSAVEAAFVLAVFFPACSPSRSKSTSRSCGGELMLNSPFARVWISFVRAWSCASMSRLIAARRRVSTFTPARSMSASTSTSGISIDS